MSLVAEAASLVTIKTGWLLVFLWVLEQLYNPLWETKLQQFHNDLTSRLEIIEVVQISMAQEVTDIDEDDVATLHEHDELDPSDIKNNGSDRDLTDLV